MKRLDVCSKKRVWRLNIACAVLAATSMMLGQTLMNPAPPPGDKPAFAQIALSARIVLRDSAELPMKMKVRLTATDASGRIHKQKTGSAKFLFHGYNPGSGHSSMNLRANSGVLSAALNSSSFVIAPALLLIPDVEDKARIEVRESDSPDSPWIVEMTQRAACDPLPWDADHQILTSLCGSTEYSFSRSDLTLTNFVFVSTGPPVQSKVAPFGLSTLQSYRLSAELQKIMLPNDPKPFLIPKHITVTILTNNGRVEIDTRITEQ